MYLGDGCISALAKGSYRLRITLDARYPGLICECAAAMRAVAPLWRKSPGQAGRASRRGELLLEGLARSCFHNTGQDASIFARSSLSDWQQDIVDRHPKLFLSGLIHSDGCRCINKSMGHEYVRYFFDQVSDDIREIFCRTCDQLGIAYRQPKWRTISIARRADVAFLDEFIGPKY